MPPQLQQPSHGHSGAMCVMFDRHFVHFGANKTERLWLLQAVQLALGCLSFDFVGTCLDESAEDLGTIQVRLRPPCMLTFPWAPDHPQSPVHPHTSFVPCSPSPYAGVSRPSKSHYMQACRVLAHALLAAGALHLAARPGGPGDAAAVPGFLRDHQAAALQHGAGVPGAHI